MPDDRKKKIEQISNAILGSARNELYISMRFLDIALHSLSFQMNLSTRSIGTDGRAILYNPGYLAREYQEDRREINRVYLHMLLHGMFCHMMHADEKEPVFWNLACDIAAESIIDGLEYPCVRRVVSDERNEMYQRLNKEIPVLTAEGIYKTLRRQQMSYKEAQEWSRIFLADDHGFWEVLKDEKRPGAEGPGGDGGHGEADGRPPGQREGEEPGKDGGGSGGESGGEKTHSRASSVPNMSRKQRGELEKKWNDIAGKTKTNMETFSREAAKNAGALTRAIRIQTRRRQDYREFLRRFAVRREEMKLDPDTFDLGYYSYGMQVYGNMPLLEPVEWREEKKIQEFVIAVDTSGSCSGERIRRFLEETYQILTEKENFFRKVKIHLIQCDAKVQKDEVITDLEQMKAYADRFELRGFGGTDFRPVFAHVEELKKTGVFHNLKGLIYFTDGLGTYPKKRPDYDTAFVYVGSDWEVGEIPPWVIPIWLSE